MYKYFLILLFSISVFAQDNSIYIWNQTLNDDFEFKGIPNGCYNYALKLHNKLKNKTDSFIIVYQWKNGSKIGSHALVAFLVDKKYFVVDNLKSPKLVLGSNFYSWIIQYDKFAKEVTNIRIER
jgi:hypothetical protein